MAKDLLQLALWFLLLRGLGPVASLEVKNLEHITGDVAVDKAGTTEEPTTDTSSSLITHMLPSRLSGALSRAQHEHHDVLSFVEIESSGHSLAFHKRKRLQLGPIDCQYSQWQTVGSCSVSCGNGIATQTRNAAITAANGGFDCDESAMMQTTTCIGSYGAKCPQYCSWDQWGSWSNCTGKCAGTNASRQRTIQLQGTIDGRPCFPALSQQSRSCNFTMECVDCTWSSWVEPFAHTQWACTKGLRQLYRQQASLALGSGLNCSEHDFSLKIPCNASEVV